MNHAGFENKLTQKVRWLIQGLIISVALNIGLLATFVSLVLREKYTPVERFHAQDSKGKVEEKLFTNQALLKEYASKSFYDLVSYLGDDTLVEEGLRKRDLALAALVTFHHFNLEKALEGTLPAKRMVSFYNHKKEAVTMAVYPDLGELHFKVISQYAQTEKWPITSKGLFFALKKAGAAADKELLEAFYLTPEFFNIATVLGRTEVLLEKVKILQMILESPWDVLEKQHHKLQNTQEFSLSQRRDVLLDYISAHSRTAAEIFIHYDTEFVSKRLDNESVLAILDTGFERGEIFINLCKELLLSPRSEKVHKRVTEMLYFLSGESLPSRYSYEEAVAHFCPPKKEAEVHLVASPIAAAPSKVESKTEKKTASYTHLVQEGESLWSISKKYKVSLEALMAENHLDSEKIRPGKTLKIPKKR